MALQTSSLDLVDKLHGVVYSSDSRQFFQYNWEALWPKLHTPVCFLIRVYEIKEAIKEQMWTIGER